MHSCQIFPGIYLTLPDLFEMNQLRNLQEFELVKPFDEEIVPKYTHSDAKVTEVKSKGSLPFWNLIPTNSHKSVLLKTEKDLHHQKGLKRTFGH